eukprot:3365153-Rhodomonas_salina.1
MPIRQQWATPLSLRFGERGWITAHAIRKHRLRWRLPCVVRCMSLRMKAIVMRAHRGNRMRTKERIVHEVIFGLLSKLVLGPVEVPQGKIKAQPVQSQYKV